MPPSIIEERGRRHGVLGAHVMRHPIAVILDMDNLLLSIVIPYLILYAGCYTTLPTASRTPLPKPDFISKIVSAHSTVTHKPTGFFYAYEFGTKEGDWEMTPDWALANLYHAGIRVNEAWYSTEARPRLPGRMMTKTIYPPLFVVSLGSQDDYITHFRYRRLDGFDPIRISDNIATPLIQYVLE